MREYIDIVMGHRNRDHEGKVVGEFINSAISAKTKVPLGFSFETTVSPPDRNKSR